MHVHAPGSPFPSPQSLSMRLVVHVISHTLYRSDFHQLYGKLECVSDMMWRSENLPKAIKCNVIILYNEKYFSDDHFSYNIIVRVLTWVAWICILDATGCYERAARAERKSTLQGSGLVRTVGPCAQKRVALVPWAIATARDTLLNDRCESTTL